MDGLPPTTVIDSALLQQPAQVTHTPQNSELDLWSSADFQPFSAERIYDSLTLNRLRNDENHVSLPKDGFQASDGLKPSEESTDDG